MTPRLLPAVVWLAAAFPVAAEVPLIHPLTPWRAMVVTGPDLRSEDGELFVPDRRQRVPFDVTGAENEGQAAAFSPRPPEEWIAPEDSGDQHGPMALFRPHRVVVEDWRTPEFDDRHWPRYQADELFDYVGDYGVAVRGRTWLSSLHLRTRFGILDPARATDLRLTVTFIGGAVAYVNGIEVGRAFLPEGDLPPLTPAAPYPAEAYATTEGTPLPMVSPTESPAPELEPHYRSRIRTAEFRIPPEALRAGGNTLAVEIRRAPVQGPMGRDAWNHLAFREITLASPSGQGVIPYDEALAGPRVWSAEALDAVAASAPERPLVRRRWGWGTVGSVRGRPVQGTLAGNPFDPLRPIRMATPRGGTASGQVVLADPAGLRNVAVRIEADLQGDGRASLPASAVRILYAGPNPRTHDLDGLVATPPADATVLPVWLVAEIPQDQFPGWYEGSLRLEANGVDFRVPVQVLVTGLTLPPPRDFTGSDLYVATSPKSVAMQYGVDLWSDEHFRHMEASFRLQAQLGNDLVFVPVIVCNFHPVPKSWRGGRASEEDRWHAPMVRWVETDEGLRPDFRILDRYLDAYARHAGPPRALTLGIWSAASARELADAYEGRRQPSVEVEQRSPLEVEVWDPETGRVERRVIPAILDPEGETFWRPLLDGVRDRVVRRGWSERIIMLGLGGDMRMGRQTVEKVREWAPYARWDLLSHFSGDPGPEDGRLIATGGLEIGVMGLPGLRPALARVLEARLATPPEYLELPTARWQHDPHSPLLLYRALPLVFGRLGHLGLDFWQPDGAGPRNHGFWTHTQALAVPGPDGAMPTVRFQMLREGVQDQEIRTMLVRAYLALPEDEREPYRDLLDELHRRIAWGGGYISNHEMAFDWPTYAAQVQEAAADLIGPRIHARWDRPPAARR